jgi:hypothetical protein
VLLFSESVIHQLFRENVTLMEKEVTLNSRNWQWWELAVAGRGDLYLISGRYQLLS